MRWQDARLHPLSKLQDRVHLHSGREEAPAAQGVRYAQHTLECAVADS